MAMAAGAMLQAFMRAASEDRYFRLSSWVRSFVELLPQYYAAEALTSLSNLREASYLAWNLLVTNRVLRDNIHKQGRRRSSWIESLRSSMPEFGSERGRRMKHLLMQGWLFVAIGAALIAVGGAFTTFGWNKLNLRSQLEAIVSGVAREWEINDTLLHKEPLFVSNEPDVLGSFGLYPRFKSSAIDSALSSGLFNPSNADEREFLRALADYETTIADVNARLTVSDNLALSTRDRAVVADHRVYVKGSRGFAAFGAEHQKLKGILEKQHRWALEKKFLN
nr:hypothetical protein [uncultured Steroidobacter sp.]